MNVGVRLGWVVNSTPRPLYLKKIALVPTLKTLGATQTRCEGVCRSENPFLQSGFELRVAQPVASRKTWVKVGSIGPSAHQCPPCGRRRVLPSSATTLGFPLDGQMYALRRPMPRPESHTECPLRRFINPSRGTSCMALLSTTEWAKKLSKCLHKHHDFKKHKISKMTNLFMGLTWMFLLKCCYSRFYLSLCTVHRYNSKSDIQSAVQHPDIFL